MFLKFIFRFFLKLNEFKILESIFVVLIWFLIVSIWIIIYVMSVLLFLEEVKFKNNIYINRYMRKVKVLEFVGDEGGVVKVKEIICEN